MFKSLNSSETKTELGILLLRTSNPSRHHLPSDQERDRHRLFQCRWALGGRWRVRRADLELRPDWAKGLVAK